LQVIPINKQPIEKRNNEARSLEVHSIFLTIQGEGPFTGYPAVFIRLAGCNLQCPSCDTDYTNGRKGMSVEAIVSEVKSVHSECNARPIVVITGGEPFRQNIEQLVELLLRQDFTVQVETNGTLAPLNVQAPVWFNRKFHIVCSPKAGKVHNWIANRADCFKYVLSADSVDPEDGLPILALNHTASPRVARPFFSTKNKPIYLQPMDAKDQAKNDANVCAVLQSCIKHGYIFQLQTHKYIGVE